MFNLRSQNVKMFLIIIGERRRINLKGRVIFNFSLVWDRDHSIESVQKLVSSASTLYKQKQAANKITLEQPDTFNHFPDSLQKVVVEWIGRINSNLTH